MTGTLHGNRSYAVSNSRTFLLVACLSLLASSLAAPIRMSKTAERKFNKKKITNRLEKIASTKRDLILKKHHHKHKHDNPNSCTSYSCSQLASAWNWPGDIPNCPGKNCDWSGSGGDDDTSGGGDDDGSGGGGGGGDDTTQNDGGGDDTQNDGGDDVTQNDGGDDDTQNDGGDDDAGGDNTPQDGGDDDYDEFNDFDLQNCSSYSEFWLWDLALTCDKDATNTTDCECTSAAILLSNGLLDCPNATNSAPYCPEGCDLCDTCLTLLGCQETKPPGGNPFKRNFSMGVLFYLLAAVAGILLGVVGVMVHSKKKQGPLKENLVEGEVPPTGGEDDNVWLAPVSN